MRGGNSRLLVYWGDLEAATAFHERLQSCPYLGLRMAASTPCCQAAGAESYPKTFEIGYLDP